MRSDIRGLSLALGLIGTLGLAACGPSSPPANNTSASVGASAGDVSVSVPTDGAKDAMKAAGAATDASVSLPPQSADAEMNAMAASVNGGQEKKKK